MVLDGSRVRAVGPILAQPHGSLGRYLAKDIHVRWMTSTISCLFEYDSEGFISDTLCAFIMQSSLAGGQKPLSENRLAHHPMRLEIKPTIDKIVSSIWCNVVNSLGLERTSKSVLRLPKELQDVCPRGHNLESHALGLVMSRLRDSSTEGITESDHMLTNLTLWLFFHFHGKLRVVVSGVTVYEKDFGDEEKQIELRSKRFCDPDAECKPDSGKPIFKLFTVVGGKLDTHLISGTYDTQMTYESVSRVRQPLYKSPVSYRGTAVSRSLKLRIRSTAKKIMVWLLDREVERVEDSNQLRFRVLHDVITRGKSLTVADIVAKVPRIRNMDWDLDEDSVSVIHDPKPILDYGQWYGGGEAQDNPGNLLMHFPILEDLLDEVMQSCECHICKRSGPFSGEHGCLRRVALYEVVFYIAHAIADAFGAPDSSARSVKEVESDDLGVSQILLDAAGPGQQTIRWESWLNTATRVVLGCGSLSKIGVTNKDKYYVDKMNFPGRTTTVAVQFAGLAVIAPWLDLAIPISAGGLLWDDCSERPDWRRRQTLGWEHSISARRCRTGCSSNIADRRNIEFRRTVSKRTRTPRYRSSYANRPF